MKRPAVIIAAAAALSAAAIPLVLGTADAAGPLDLASVRAATAQFHDVDRAIASGRTDLHLCVDMMGEHFADPSTFSDGILDPKAPEAMVYAHQDGQLRLVAVEWVSTTPGSVMGRPLHLNPALNVYVLHAWIWAHNPDGMFTDMNPQIGSCP